MKKIIMWLFNIKPEIKYVDRVIERVIEKDPDMPNGSILIEGDILKIGDIEMGIE